MTKDRLCDVFLQKRGLFLGDHGLEADLTDVERTDKGEYVVYHYTRKENLAAIYQTGGLVARLPVVAAEHLPNLKGRFLVEGWLAPYPVWLAESKYFGDFCLSMLRRYVGSVLLRITLPAGSRGVYVAEMAHNMDCKFEQQHGRSALNLGYQCQTGVEVTRAEANSYVPIRDYLGGHVLPNVKITRRGEGLVVPLEYLAVSEYQPLSE